MNKLYAILAGFVFVLVPFAGQAQTIYEYSQDDAKILFFDKNLSQYIPHLVRMYENGKALHNQIWQTDSTHYYNPQPPLMLVTDWEDDGNGGVTSIPQNLISIGMAPLNFSYFVSPSTERYHHLFRHEYTHTIMADKPAASERFWRSVTGGKFSTDPKHPFSALWSFLGAPRWYAPRWYHEGIACFMETWTGGGVGRALGGYDEMYFRSIVNENEPLYSVVGLETEGTTSDFQVGANSYLYGTRFVNYLELQHGFDKLRDFYNRTEDSKALINRQFEKVYGTSLRKEWDRWKEYEYNHQKEQLKTISEYALTETTPLTGQAMGSMSPMVVDEENNCAYAAVNYPGDFAHIERIDLKTLERKTLHTVDGPQLYQTCYITLDRKGQRLIYTTQNSKYRGIRVLDLNKGKIVKKLNFQRVSDVVYSDANDCLYGIMRNGGVMYLVKYDSNIENETLLYSFPFGLSVFDLDVSHDGKWISAAISGDNGEQSLIRFDAKGLENADLRYETLFTLEDSNLGQFKFAPGDSTMVGSSYYTGVSNIWSLNLETKDFELLSNTATGLFSPVRREDGSMLALEFERNGMRPVAFDYKVLNDANAVTLLGQKAYEAHPEELESLAVLQKPVEEIKFGDVYNEIKEYNTFKGLRFAGAFPEISGFRDKEAWNGVTPVIGYRIGFQDAIGLHSLKMSVGVSPWSSNDAKNQYHAQIEWKFWSWTVNAAWNPTSFYDLVGPIQSSRKGWQANISYDRSYSMISPFSHDYGFSLGAYGMMDALPMYQNIEVQDGISSFETISAYYDFKKSRSTLGAVTRESGYDLGIDGYAYLAGGKFFPTVVAKGNLGFLVPGIKNTCFWLRSAVGQSFGDPDSVFGNEYFGGFGNNWVDYREANRYRTVNAMPGAGIDAIKAHSFAKLTGELNMKPIRYNNFGLLNIYPTYSQFSLFGSALASNPWEKMERNLYFNAGIQLNTEVVLFKYLTTTWSVGYARIFYPDGTNGGDWLISLKLL